MDPLHFFIAIGPLTAYLLLLGIVNLRRQPFVTTGARDAAALGVGLCGFAIAGPMELFLPESANRWFPGGVWILLILLYVLCLSLTVLLLRPRLVIYNAKIEDVRPRLAALFTELDKDARWAGDCVSLPNLKVQLSIEAQPILRTIQFVSAGPHQDPFGWKHVEKAVQRDVRQLESRPMPFGYGLVSVSFLLAVVTAIWVLVRRQDVADSLAEMLRL